MAVETTSRLATVFANANLIYFLAFIGTFLMVYNYGRRYLRMMQVAAKIPGPDISTMAKLSLGSVYAEPHDVYKNIYDMMSPYKDIAKIWLGPKLIIFLFNPADIELILSSNVHLDKSSDYGVFKPWFGNGLLISTGPKWKHHRKMIAPTFHQSILKNFVSKFYDNSIKICNIIDREQKGNTFDAHEYMSGATADILLDTAMGYTGPRGEKTAHDYAMAVLKLSDILHRRHYKLWLRPDRLFEYTSWGGKHKQLLDVVQGLTRTVIRHKKNEILKKGVDKVDTIEQTEVKQTFTPKKKEVKISGYNNGTAVRDDLDENDEDIGEKKRLAFLEQLTVNAQREDVDFSEQELLDQVNTIMFEGHDTTASASSFSLCMLGIHKDIQERVIKEIDGIFQKSDRACTFADTLEMKYLERVIMETLRMYPPVPVIARQLQEEVKLPSGDYCLPTGTTVVITQAILHRRADVFPNPDVFNPDNFLPEKCQDRHFYSYIPFSAGPRSCVGRKFAMLKLKVMLSTILRNYRVNCDMSEKDFKLKGDLILKMDNGFNINLMPRKDAMVA